MIDKEKLLKNWNNLKNKTNIQILKLADKKSKGPLWFINALDHARKFIERDTTVIIDYLLSERRKGNVQFKEITAKPLNAWRKDNKKIKAIELNLSVVNGAVIFYRTKAFRVLCGVEKPWRAKITTPTQCKLRKAERRKSTSLQK